MKATVTKASLVVVLSCLVLAPLAEAITIDTVSVGHAGNAADSTGYGAVSYTYNVGKYEVTAGQYTAFLNSVATASDVYGLYNDNMALDPYGCQIVRSGDLGAYAYSVAAEYADRAVNYVSFWDSLRFANWLNNGQGAASTETGAYTLTDDGIANNTVTRNADWKWAVTGEDEWYKAAYYDAATDSYFLYPTSSNDAPGDDPSDLAGNNANWNNNPGGTSVAGTYANSASPNGTYDQGGNVWEWNETAVGGSRGERGGAFDSYGTLALSSGVSIYDDPMYGEYSSLGFRVVNTPEPLSMVMLGCVGAGMALARRLRRKS